MFSLFNFLPIFPAGGQLIPFAPMCGRPWPILTFDDDRLTIVDRPTLQNMLFKTFGGIFTARCYASAVLAMALCLSVRPSVRPSQVGVLLTTLQNVLFKTATERFKQHILQGWPVDYS